VTPSIIFFCETWHINNFCNKQIISDYEVFEIHGVRSQARGRYSRGYVLGIKKDLFPHYKMLMHTSEFCFIEIKDIYKTYNILFAYLPPSSLTDLQEVLTVVNPHIETIVIGDFNARIGNFNPSLSNYDRVSKDSVVNARGRRLISLINIHNFSILNGCTKSDATGEFTFVNRNGSSCIDLCLINAVNNLDADFEVLGYEGSCHFPILFSLNHHYIQNQTVSMKVVRWSQSEADNFRNALENLFAYHPTESMNMSCFANLVMNSLSSCNMIKRRVLSNSSIVNGPAWFDEKCLAFKDICRKALRMYRNTLAGTPENCFNRIKYLESKRSYTNLLEAKKRKFYLNVQQKLTDATNASQFYRALSYFRPKYQNSSNSEYVNPEEFYSYFSKQFNLYPSNKIAIGMNETVLDELDSDFTLEELDTAIKKLSNAKAAGSDGIPNEVWKNISCDQRTILLESMNNCWNSCVFPAEWSDIIMCPIFKKGNMKQPENYRPISLLNTGLKLYTMMMSNRLNSWCENNSKVSDYQAAYRKGKGCEDHIFVLTAALQANVSKRRKLYALFVDLSKAFDCIRHDKLWSKLQAIGISSKFINNIKCLYLNAKGKIRTRFGESRCFSMTNSVFQGETLTPKLFTLFIEDIIEILNSSNISSVKIGKADINILLYADDMILLAYNCFDLQEKIRILETYFAKNDLSIHLSKTKVVIFHYGKSRVRKPKIFWGDEEIEIVDHYVYLGIPMYGNMNFLKIHCQR
jgi:hypothetical protein